MSPHLPLSGGYGPLTGNEDVGPEVMLPPCEIVVALDAFVLMEAPGQFVQRLQRPVCHFVPVEPGELLAPVQVGQVVLELRGVLDQVGQVPVGELDEPALHELPGGLDVEVGDLVADAPAARVEEGPDPALLVQRDLDEVVARAQGPQLSPPVLVPLVVEVQPAGPGRLFLQLPDPGGRRSLDTAVVPARAQGYPALMPSRTLRRLVGRSSPFRGVLTAIMPQPMSTPAGAGGRTNFRVLLPPAGQCPRQNGQLRSSRSRQEYCTKDVERCHLLTDLSD